MVGSRPPCSWWFWSFPIWKTCDRQVWGNHILILRVERFNMFVQPITFCSALGVWNTVKLVVLTKEIHKNLDFSVLNFEPIFPLQLWLANCPRIKIPGIMHTALETGVHKKMSSKNTANPKSIPVPFETAWFSWVESSFGVSKNPTATFWIKMEA